MFKEENLPYRIDNSGGVHPLVDQAFDQEREAIIKGLGLSQFKAAKIAMENAFNAIKSDGSGTLEAVRFCFDALENIFKSKFDVSRLGDTEITKKLVPLIETKYEGRSKDSAKLLLHSFQKYVNAAHSYRHADGEKEPSPPPLEVAVLFLSQGSSYLRWLLEFK